jgi:hypothetical protein
MATWPRIDRPSFTGLRWLPILSYRGRCSATIEACGGRGMRTSARHVRAFFHLNALTELRRRHNCGGSKKKELHAAVRASIARLPIGRRRCCRTLRG